MPPLVLAIHARFVAEERRQRRLLCHKIMHLTTILGEIVQLFLPVLRRRDELEERMVVAIEHREAIWHEVRLVIREALEDRREQRLAFPRGRNRQSEAVQNRWRNVHLHGKPENALR